MQIPFNFYFNDNTALSKKQTYIQKICSIFLLESIDRQKYVRYNAGIKNACSQRLFWFLNIIRFFVVRTFEIDTVLIHLGTDQMLNLKRGVDKT